MRSIQVSTDVFARIWAMRQEGEDSEDVILRRALQDRTSQVVSPVVNPSANGFHDSKYNVSFPENFEIFRIYKGKKYTAKAVNGKWFLINNGQLYRSLNELSSTVGAKTENAWINWFYLDAYQNKRPVSYLRSPDTIIKRARESVMDIMPEKKGVPLIQPIDYINPNGDGTWRDDVQYALLQRSGKASLHQIYKDVEMIRLRGGRSVPSRLEATIRRTLEDHSSDSDNYRGLDLFCMPEGKGAGIWALRDPHKLKK
ncbi:MAG: hypothetical protein K8R48_10490 [Alphaproteobacteria bacterium]|nr:hypothetical protein [Alphaproteobacteria bacterium]